MHNMHSYTVDDYIITTNIHNHNINDEVRRTILNRRDGWETH